MKKLTLEEALPLVRQGKIVYHERESTEVLKIINNIVQISGCVYPWADGYCLKPDPVEEAICAGEQHINNTVNATYRSQFATDILSHLSKIRTAYRAKLAETK